jgi:iron complex outermembrane receptor protein
VAVDYFRFQLNDEVDQLGNTIPFRCYNSADFPTDQLCTLFTRDPDTQIIDTIQDNYINIAKQKNYGLDLTVRYGRDLPWDVRMTADLQATWQFKDSKQIFETITDLNGFVGDPDFTAIASLAFQKDDWTVFWGVDMVGKASDAEEDSDGAPRSPQTSSDGLHNYKTFTEFTAYHSLAVRKTFGEDLEVLAGVANVFDEAPPAVSRDAQPGVFGGGQKGVSFLGSQYDFIGRRFHMSVTKRF